MKKKRSYWKLIWPQLYSSATLSKVSVCSVFRHRGKGCIFSPQRYQSDGRSCCLINGCEATTPPFTVPAQNHGAEIFFSTSPFPFPRWKAAIAGAWNWSRHWNTDKQPECGREQGDSKRDQGDVRKAHCAVFVIWRENSYLLCCCGLLPSSVIIFFFFFKLLSDAGLPDRGAVLQSELFIFKRRVRHHTFVTQKLPIFTWLEDLTLSNDQIHVFVTPQGLGNLLDYF